MIVSPEGAALLCFQRPARRTGAKAWIVGGGIAWMSAAAFMIRDGDMLAELLGLDRRAPPVYKRAFDPRVLVQAIVALHDLGEHPPEQRVLMRFDPAGKAIRGSAGSSKRAVSVLDRRFHSLQSTRQVSLISEASSSQRSPSFRVRFQ